MEFVTRNFCPPRVPHMTAEGERCYKFQGTHFSAQKDSVVSWPSAHSLPLFNQCVPGSVFVFCRAEPPEESMPASKRLDSMVCTEKLTTAEHDGGGFRLPFFFFCTRKKKRDFKKSGKRSSCISQKTGSYVLLTMKKRVYLFQWFGEYDSYAQSERLWLNCCCFLL